MIQLRAPAKINLGLELMRRRDDGYHEIETIFLPLELFDTLTLERREEPGIELVLPDSDLPAGPENLVWRAAERTASALGYAGGLKIRLEKQIPIAAGLGGGSSDAAMTILGVEALSGSSLSDGDRHDLALALGADVPFFLSPQVAYGRGVGEILEPIPGVPPMWWVLAAFPFPVATPWAYQQASSRLTLPRDASSIAALLGPSGVLSSPPNDLETVAADRYPQIREVRRALERVGAMITGMSGSGPTVFGRFQDRDAAARGSSEVKLPDGVKTMVVRSPGSTSDWEWGVAKR